jgi:CHAT domain-containing protein
LVFFVDLSQFGRLPEETLAFVVTKTDVRWVRLALGRSALSREVAALRCGLDYYGSWGAPNSRCSELLNVTYSAADNLVGNPLPFDPVRAHALYKALFGKVEDLIKGKHVLVVPSGPLTQLPFHVLVTTKPEKAKPDPADYHEIAWFARSHAITVLPAVSSLKALRQNAKPSQATKPFLGIGNPLLDGPDDSYADLKQAALERKSCLGLGPVRVAEIQRGGGVKPFAQRGGIAEVAELRLAPPLPETADELCDVAKAVGATEADILLGARASEGEIKRLSEAGILRSYRIVHFATHGALAGEISVSAEPGLLLTPPQMGTEADDGYLSASEIAGLKLDADWVILSACNTAAAEAKGAEALSGLARAFFYAGARALLVSHWAVDTEATVKLVTGAVERMASDRTVGRAEAMRQSMLAMIDKGKTYEAHPKFWAPFVAVGEGGAER